MAQTTTFSTLKDSIIRRNHDMLGDKAIAYVEESIQDALRKLAQVMDWSFLKDRTRINTVDDYATGTISVSLGQTAVTGSLTVWTTPALDETWTLKLNGENIDYDVSTNSTTSTSLLINHAYVGSANLSNVAYIAFKRSYDLPANFRELEDIVDVQNPNWELIRTTQKEIVQRNLNRSGGARPRWYKIENKKGDTVRQLWLYPFPDAIYQYDMIYSRWPDNPLLDADIIDWPDQLIPLLRNAVELELAQKNNDFERLNLAQHQYATALETAMDADVPDSTSRYIGTRAGRRRVRINNLDLSVSEGG